jgi:hypothetical protein
MAGRREMPQFFDIDDTVPKRTPAVPARAEDGISTALPTTMEEDRT